MFVRALTAFLVLPGMVAFTGPVLVLAATSHTTIVHPLGVVPLLAGAGALLACVRDFYVSGKGTLAPWSPPENLVEVGLYRFSRNPMYVAVVLMLAGWSITFGSWVLAAYALVVLAAFHVRVVTGEEPFLARTHGDRWTEYRARVPRWIGRRGHS